MGLFDRLFKKSTEQTIMPEGSIFEVLTGYAPVFTNASENLYEVDLIRGAIHSFASFCSKLKPEVHGEKLKRFNKQWQYKINPFQSTSQFIYRLATIFAVKNTAFIVPIEDAGGKPVGFYPLNPTMCEIIESEGVIYLRYTFGNGRRAVVEFDRVGILTQHQYEDEFFGTDNRDALKPTLQLIHTQNLGIISGVKNSATIRFLAKIGNIIKAEDIKKERDRFTEENLSEDNQSGMIIYDNKFADVKQVDSKPFTVNALQMGHIRDNVYSYFGTNESIVQNKYGEDEWNAYFEGKIAPFALQLSLVMSNMVFTLDDIERDNAIYFTSNRLQYASNTTKLQISQTMFDRGLLTRNQVMDIWSLPHVEGGDLFYIRKEYAKLEDLGKEWLYDEDGNPVGNPPNEPSDGGEPPNPPGKPPGADEAKE